MTLKSPNINLICETSDLFSCFKENNYYGTSNGLEHFYLKAAKAAFFVYDSQMQATVFAGYIKTTGEMGWWYISE